MRTFLHALAWLALLLLAAVLAAPSVVAEDPFDDDGPVPPPEGFVERVNEALDHGVRWLLARPEHVTLNRTPVVHWGLIRADVNYLGGTESYTYPVGTTALALYTLLKCGVASDHPIVEKGFAWLKLRHKISEKYDGMDGAGYETSYRIGWTSYEIAVQILALTAKHDPQKRTKTTRSKRRRGKLKIGDRDDRDWLKELVAVLVARRGECGEDKTPEARRGWRYNGVYAQTWPGSGKAHVQRAAYIPPANQDLSSTQLAALALYSAHQFGAKADAEVWRDIATFTLDSQEEEGPEHERHDPGMHADGYAAPKDHARGFCYIKGSEGVNEGTPTGAMTACGIANLVMARDVLSESSRGKKLWKKHTLDARVETAIYDGRAWLDLNWSPFANPPPPNPRYHTYYLYALERAMDLLGKELIGKHRWYREGAEQLLERSHGMRVEGRKDVEDGAGMYWDTDSTLEPQDVQDTCFTLLFLKRATKSLAPVVTGD